MFSARKRNLASAPAAVTGSASSTRFAATFTPSSALIYRSSAWQLPVRASASASAKLIALLKGAL